jgi:hypothetical protein
VLPSGKQSGSFWNHPTIASAPIATISWVLANRFLMIGDFKRSIFANFLVILGDLAGEKREETR